MEQEEHDVEEEKRNVEEEEEEVGKVLEIRIRMRAFQKMQEMQEM